MIAAPTKVLFTLFLIIISCILFSQPISCSIILKSHGYQIDSHLRINGNLVVDGSVPQSIQEKLLQEQKLIKRAQLEQSIWDSNEWVNRTSVLQLGPRMYHQMFEFQGRYFVTGGRFGPTWANKEFATYELDPYRRMVINTTIANKSLVCSYVCSFTDHVLGVVDVSPSAQRIDTIHLFNITSLEWEEKGNIFNGSLSGMFGCDDSTDTMYIAGGSQAGTAVTNMLTVSVESDDTVTWMPKPDIIPARVHGIGGFIDGSFIYGLGQMVGGAYSSQIFLYSDTTNSHDEITSTYNIPELAKPIYLQIGRAIYAYGILSHQGSGAKPSLYRFEFDSSLESVQAFLFQTTEEYSSVYVAAGFLAYPVRTPGFYELAVYGGLLPDYDAGDGFSTIQIPTGGDTLSD